jgi:gas vesicle structural protein
MDLERTGTTSVIDVLDRVLDKGIVIDAWMRISLCGLDLVTINTRVLVASIETYLKYSNLVAVAPAVAAPGLAFSSPQS